VRVRASHHQRGELRTPCQDTKTAPSRSICTVLLVREWSHIAKCVRCVPNTPEREWPGLATGLACQPPHSKGPKHHSQVHRATSKAQPASHPQQQGAHYTTARRTCRTQPSPPPAAAATPPGSPRLWGTGYRARRWSRTPQAAPAAGGSGSCAAPLRRSRLRGGVWAW